MLNNLDQQLLEALSFGRFDNAEALIQKGADINALTSAHELDYLLSWPMPFLKKLLPRPHC